MLAMLLDFPPGKFGKDEWSFAHARDHEEIRAAIQDQYLINLPIYQVDPMVFTNDSVFMVNNQQMHNDMLAVLGIASTDISNLDFNDRSQIRAWLNVHFEDHRNARSALGI